MDIRMTQKIKEMAYELGADLVGFANIGRYDEAPLKMSPIGILPTAKSVIVCAIHHPDATIELEGGERGKSQDFESYKVQYMMNPKLDHISFQIGRYLDNLGYKTVPIVSSNIWRYRSYKELEAVFAPDMSHIYSAVCAGLAELGWHGLAITPEYGPRCRFVSIITEAELEPTPLLPGGTLCDMCGECIRHCPTDSYRKEVNGVKKINIRDVDGKVYTHKFANKNLWRCAWAEHFNIDLDDEVPDKVTEEVILDRIAKKGMRHGEMGVCLKSCVPKSIREKDESSDFYRRRRFLADKSLPVSREAYDHMSTIALKYHAERITIVSYDKLTKLGYAPKTVLPDARNVIFISAKTPSVVALPTELQEKMNSVVDDALLYGLGFANYDIARYVEKIGYSVLPDMDSSCDYFSNFADYKLEDGEKVVVKGIITDAPLEERDWFLDAGDSEESGASLKDLLLDTVKEYGADMMGVSPAERIDAIVDQLKPLKDGETLLEAKDKNPYFKVFDPDIKELPRKLYKVSDYFADAKNVIVIGLSYAEAAATRAGREPSESVGPFMFGQAQAQIELSGIGYEVMKTLKRRGYKAAIARDLIGMGSYVASPSGLSFSGKTSSPFVGAFEAAAAGLGEITYSGTVDTEKYGVNQRFICIVTDAPLEADAVKENKVQKICADCGKCLEACPMKALKADEKVEIEIEGNRFDYIPLDTVACEWASRYVLTNRDGFDRMGATLNIMPNGKITVDTLADGLRQRDPLAKSRSGNAEKCITECPLTYRKYKE